MSTASLNKSHTDSMTRPTPLWHHLVPFTMVVLVLTSIILGATYGLQFLASHLSSVVSG